LDRLPDPKIAVLVGGQAPTTVFSEDVARDLGVKIRQAVQSIHGSVLLTTSRRTPKKVTDALLEEMRGVPVYFHNPTTASPEDLNPYMGFLSKASAIIVTGDSLSMVSEAASTGLPLYVFAPNSILEPRHALLIVDLYHSKRLRFFEGALDVDWGYAPLTVAADIHGEIVRRWNCRQLLRAASSASF
jgi:mitochondrial fission protein ELM1